MKNIHCITFILSLGLLTLWGCTEDSFTSLDEEQSTVLLKAKGKKGKPTPYVVRLIGGDVNSNVDGNAGGNQLYTQFENESIRITEQYLLNDDLYEIDSLSKGAQFTSFEINQEGRVVTTQFWIADSKGRGFVSPVLTVNVDEQGPETIVDDDFIVYIDQPVTVGGNVNLKKGKPQKEEVATVFLGQLHFSR